MKPPKRLVVLLAFPIALALLVLGALWAVVVGDVGCENKTIVEVPSPQARYRAVVFVRSCGATTGDSTQVSLLSGDDPPPGAAGNLFVADDDHGAAPVDAQGMLPVTVHWRGDRTLHIAHHPAARVFKSERTSTEVTIGYELTSTASPEPLGN